MVISDMENAIRESCQLLKEGKTLLYPSDTIWGLGCDATNEAAVEKIFDIKDRPSSKSPHRAGKQRRHAGKICERSTCGSLGDHWTILPNPPPLFTRKQKIWQPI